MKYINSYAQLDSRLYHKQMPTPLDNPNAGHFNSIVAEQLGWNEDVELMTNWVDILSGHKVPDEFEPLAMAYAGHQFGHWAGQLGDGRGLLMAQVLDNNNKLTDLHLKGMGLTPYSRQGDGRAVLRSTIREYLCGHAMNQLGIASSNALGFITSETPVRREQMEQGAALMRVADSHIRLGHVEWIANFEPELLPEFTRYMIETYYPEVLTSNTPVQDFISAVVTRTAKMIADWQLVGFAHGVMNTDNLSITGSTLDYGPFGFLERFNPAWINNHSDYSGRYSYQNQPAIGHWNLQVWMRHFTSLTDIEVIEGVTETIDKVSLEQCIAQYEPNFMRHYQQGVCRKLGLPWILDDDDELLQPVELINTTLRLAFEWLEILEQNRIDYTNGWRALAAVANSNNDAHQHEANLLTTILNELKEAEAKTCSQSSELDAETTSTTSSDSHLKQPTAIIEDWQTRYLAHLQSYFTIVNELDLEDTSINAPISTNDVANVIKQHNPAYILRNAMAQKAITLAQAGDFSEVDRIFKLLTNPYCVEEGTSDNPMGFATIADITPPTKDAKPLIISCSS